GPSSPSILPLETHPSPTTTTLNQSKRVGFVMRVTDKLLVSATISVHRNPVAVSPNNHRCFLGGHLDGRNVPLLPFPRHDGPAARLALSAQLRQFIVLAHGLLRVQFRVLPSTLINLGIPTIRVHNALSF